MKKIFKLRSLAVLSFLIFFLPFMRTCSDDAISSQIKSEAAVSEDMEFNEVSQNDEAYKIAFSEEKKEATFNFYKISTLIFKDFDFDTFTDTFFFAYLGFTIVLISSVLILYFSFNNKFKVIYLLSLSNLFFLFVSTMIFWLNEIIENINQFKIGYYLFVLNTFLIVYLSRKLQNAKDDLKI